MVVGMMGFVCWVGMELLVIFMLVQMEGRLVVVFIKLAQIMKRDAMSLINHIPAINKEAGIIAKEHFQTAFPKRNWVE